MMKQLFINGVIVTANEKNEWYREGYLLIEGKKIAALGEGRPDEEWIKRADKVVDLRGDWVMPGWVNTHSHAAMSILRGYADDLPLQDWLEKKMWPMEARFNSETVRWGTALAIAEMLKSGTTCFIDMYDHMDTVAQVVEESGIRAVLARGIIGLCSPEEQEAKLDEAVRFAQSWHNAAGGRITAMMSPHAPYTCPPDYIQRIVEKAELLNLPVHIHLSETRREVEQNLHDYGERPVAHLRNLGVFERPTLVAHGVHLEEEEMDILHAYDVKISHNPASNLKLGSGIASLPRFIEKGFQPSIGTDSAASNNNLDMFQEVRLAALIHKGVQEDPTVVPASIALKMGTLWGAQSAFLPQIGSLEPGKEADFIVINSAQPHLQPVHDPVSHIIYSARGSDVRHVFVQGRQVVKDGQLVCVDEERVLFEVKSIWSQLNPN